MEFWSDGFVRIGELTAKGAKARRELLRALRINILESLPGLRKFSGCKILDSAALHPGYETIKLHHLASKTDSSPAAQNDIETRDS